jgi:thymidine phosphorylase
MQIVAKSFGLQLRVLVTDGAQPVGRGIGPALEAHDVLAVLRGDKDAPADLRSRALCLAGALLEMGGVSADGQGLRAAASVLESGSAWIKFQAICDAQGGMRVPAVAPMRQPLLASQTGTVVAIDNRRLARIAKLAGAPEAKAAGVELHVKVSARVEKGQPLYSVHAETRGELAYAMDYIHGNDDPVLLSGDA